VLIARVIFHLPILRLTCSACLVTVFHAITVIADGSPRPPTFGISFRLLTIADASSVTFRRFSHLPLAVAIRYCQFGIFVTACHRFSRYARRRRFPVTRPFEARSLLACHRRIPRRHQMCQSSAVVRNKHNACSAPDAGHLLAIASPSFSGAVIFRPRRDAWRPLCATLFRRGAADAPACHDFTSLVTFSDSPLYFPRCLLAFTSSPRYPSARQAPPPAR